MQISVIICNISCKPTNAIDLVTLNNELCVHNLFRHGISPSHHIISEIPSVHIITSQLVVDFSTQQEYLVELLYNTHAHIFLEFEFMLSHR
jgi:hypothetical protein